MHAHIHTRTHTTDQPPRIYNLGSGSSRTISDFVGLLEQHMGTKVLRRYVQMPPLGDLISNRANTSRALRDLGFAPRVPLEEGVPRFVAWFRGYYNESLGDCGGGGSAWPADWSNQPAR